MWLCSHHGCCRGVVSPVCSVGFGVHRVAHGRSSEVLCGSYAGTEESHLNGCSRHHGAQNFPKNAVPVGGLYVRSIISIVVRFLF